MKKQCLKWIPLLFCLCAFAAPVQAAQQIMVALRTEGRVHRQDTYVWFVHLLKRRGFVIVYDAGRGQVVHPEGKLSFAVLWSTKGQLIASHKGIRRVFRYRHPRANAWNRARASVNFLDFFLELVIAKSQEKQKVRWRRARESLKETSQVKPAVLPALKSGSTQPPSVRKAPIAPPVRPAVKPSLVLRPRQAPNARSAPTPRPQPRPRPVPSRPLPRPSVRKVAFLRTPMRPAMAKRSPWGLAVDVGGWVALTQTFQGPFGGAGGGVVVSGSWHGWTLSAALHLRVLSAGPGDDDEEGEGKEGENEPGGTGDQEGNFLELQPVLLVGTPQWRIGSWLRLSFQLGGGLEFYQLHSGPAVAAATRPVFVAELLALLQLSKSFAMSFRPALHLAPALEEEELTTSLAFLSPALWAVTFRLGFHWQLL